MKGKETKNNRPIEEFTPQETDALKRVAAREIKQEHLKRAGQLIDSILLDAQYLDKKKAWLEFYSTSGFDDYINKAVSLRTEVVELLSHIQELKKGGPR